MLDLLYEYKFIPYSEINIGKMIDKGNRCVYKGNYNSNIVAIKEYEFNENNIFDHILSELNIGYGLKSDRLMKVYGYSYNEDKTKLYLIMEYINSCCLWEYINKSDNFEHKERIQNNYDTMYYDENKKWIYIMHNDTKISIINSLLKSIKSMWKEGILHGDLKPENLVIQRRNDEIFLKVIDYGTCHRSDLVQLDYCCGTDGFVSPELNDIHILTHKTDIYSVGVIMTEIWTGHIKHDDYKESRNYLLKQLRVIKKEDSKLEKIIRKCIEINPEKRPDIYELIKLFNNYLNTR